MLGLVGQTRLAALLQLLGEGEKKIESLRERLAVTNGYHPAVAFRCLDKGGKGYLTPSDITVYLAEFGLYPSQIEEYVIFKALDSIRRGQVSQSMLAGFLQPQNKSKAAAINSRTLTGDMVLTKEAKMLLSQLFQQMMLNHRIAEVARADLSLSHDYSPLAAAQTLDLKKDGFLDFSELEAFLRTNQRVLSRQTILSIIRAMDQDRDGVAKINQIFQALAPCQNGTYLQFTRGETIAREQVLIRSRLEEEAQHKELVDRAILRQISRRTEVPQLSSWSRMRQTQLQIARREQQLLRETEYQSYERRRLQKETQLKLLRHQQLGQLDRHAKMKRQNDQLERRLALRFQALRRK